MAKLPVMARRHAEIETRTHKALEEQRAKRTVRSRLSMSELGGCARNLWAQRMGVPDERPPDGRALMTFDVGAAIEDRITDWLTLAGYEVSTRAENGEQWRVTLPGDMASGRLDGLIRWGSPRENDWRLLEAKSAKAKRFDELIELGSYRAWSEIYYGQVQAYMGASQTSVDVPSLSDSLVVVVCKDDARLWCEMVRLDPGYFRELEAKAHAATGKSMPPRPPQARGKSSAFCRWCPRSGWCYGPLAGVDFDE